MKSGTNFAWKSPMSSTRRGLRRWESFCRSPIHFLANVVHNLLSYPLAYSLVVLPLMIPHWLLFSNKSVPSAAIFFGDIMLNLSGAIDVLLFLIVRPHILLFTSPEEPGEPNVELANPSASSTIFPDMVNDKQSPQPTGTRLTDDAWRNGLECNCRCRK